MHLKAFYSLLIPDLENSARPRRYKHIYSIKSPPRNQFPRSWPLDRGLRDNDANFGSFFFSPPVFWFEFLTHDDVIKWKHFPRYWPFVWGIHRCPVNSPQKGYWRGALMFTLICARTNDWESNLKAVDLRRHRGHYDVTVMWPGVSYKSRGNYLLFPEWRIYASQSLLFSSNPWPRKQC